MEKDKQVPSLKYFKGDELASNIWLSKYAKEGEETPEDMHKRLAKEFAMVDKKYQKQERRLNEVGQERSPYGLERADHTEESIVKLLDGFKYVVPQGSIMYGLGRGNPVSLSNCFVIDSAKDSYGGIFLADQEEAQLMKRRGGVGHDLSNLRPKGTDVHNSAKSSTGVVSFMHRFSNTTREVAQDGRRGALMLSIDINHPDVMDFIKVKRDGTSVTGANISVKLNDKFMKAVENDEDYILRFPCELPLPDADENDFEAFLYAGDYNELFETQGRYFKKIKAKEYWDEIVHSAKNYAEPGIMYWDNVLDYDPAGVYEQFKPVSSNPCFRGDMRLLTEEGYKSFKDLSGKEVNLINKDGVVVKGSVWSNGVKPIFKVNLHGRDSIYCTEDHRFMDTEGQDRPIKDMAGSRIMPEFSLNSINCEFTKLGFIQGDGSLTRLNSKEHLGLEIHIGEDDEDILDLFGYDREDGGRRFYTTEFNERLRSLGFDDRVLPDRGFPKTYGEWQDSDKLSFLRGLYSANGCVIRGHRVSFKTTSKELLSQLMAALNGFGISSYFTTNKSKEVEFTNGVYLCKESYDLNISKSSDVLEFAKKIGFVHRYKNESLTDLILKKAPLVRSVSFVEEGEVFDFNLQDDTHWGVVEGVVAHNCGEQFLQPYDSCRLMAINLFGVVTNPFTKEAKVDYKKLYEISYEQQRLADNLVELEIEYIDRILKKIDSDSEPDTVKSVERSLWEKIQDTAMKGRRTGCGITALGDMLAALGLKYDSKEALAVTEKVMKTKMKGELDCNIDLAITRGSFIGWDSKKEYLPTGDGCYTAGNTFFEVLAKEFPDQADRMRKHGRRSISWSTIAPTGSVSILTQTTSGCEPIFQPFYMRRKKINPNDEGSRVDFVDEVGDSWQEFPILHEKFREWLEVNDDLTGYSDAIQEGALDSDWLKDCFETSPWHGSTANDIDWHKRNEMQAILQKYTSNAISSTINLPSTVTEQEVSDIYKSGWKLGLKGQTVYVDGSRSGVLVDNNSKKEELVSFHENHAPKRPKKLMAKVIRFNNNYEKWVAFVGLLDGKPYEVFTGKLENVGIPNDVTVGTIIKVKSSSGKRYDFIYKGGEVQGISKVTSSNLWNYGKLISGMLRHGMPLQFVVNSVQDLNWEEDHINTWKNGIARALKKFIADGEAEGAKCKECGSENVVFQEGCLTCKDCGSSKCG